jgi:hypothetical protein
MVKLNNILNNILCAILSIILIYELFTDKKCSKEGLAPEKNPWPKGCPKSQSNIAITQSRKIDNLESRLYTFQDTMKDLEKQQKDILLNDKAVNRKIQDIIDLKISNINKNPPNIPPEGDYA